MEVKIGWDELYPYYFISNDGSYYVVEVEISEEELAFIKRADSDFFDAQEILRKIIHPNGR